jgi:hypothetical protein
MTPPILRDWRWIVTARINRKLDGRVFSFVADMYMLKGGVSVRWLSYILLSVEAYVLVIKRKLTTDIKHVDKLANIWSLKQGICGLNVPS